MSKTVRWECDCGCGETDEGYEIKGWFVLSQNDRPNLDLDPKLERKLQFKTIECLSRWVAAATEEIPELQSVARKVSPRGDFVSDRATGLIV